MASRNDMLLLAALAAIGLGVIYVGKKTVDATQADALSAYLATILPSEAAPYASDIAAGAVGNVPDDYVDPNGGDPLLRFGLVLAAIGDWESGYGTLNGYTPAGDPLGWGDAGNAFGFWQLDKHYHASFIASADAQDPNATVAAQANEAAGELASNYAAFAAVSDPLAREQLMIITYNASLSRVKNLINGGASIAAADATTTQRYGQGYGAGVENLLSTWTSGGGSISLANLV